MTKEHWSQFSSSLSEAHQSLGVHLAPGGKDEAEIKYLHVVAHQWQMAMAGAKVSHSAAKFRIWQVILHELK